MDNETGHIWGKGTEDRIEFKSKCRAVLIALCVGKPAVTTHVASVMKVSPTWPT